MERSSMAAVITTDVRRLKTKATNLDKKTKSMRRLLLSRRLRALVDVLWAIQYACCESEKQAADYNNDVESWLKELRVAILRTDDLLDTINLGRLPWTRRGHLLLAIPGVLHFAACRRLKLAVREFDAIARNARSFSPKDDDLIGHVDAAPQVMPTTYYGREEDKKNLTNLIHHGEPFAVIAVVGMAGSGKSTLARFIYNDQRQNFDCRMLVGRNHSTGAAHRSVMYGRRQLPLTELGIARSLIVGEDAQEEHRRHIELSITDFGPHGRRLSFQPPAAAEDDQFESAVRAITQSLHGVRFLLVLLDVNNVARRDLYEQLMQELQNAGRRGSTVILTTTNTEFESTQSSTEQSSRRSCSVDSLSRQDSWRLFKEHASLLHLPDTHHFWFPSIIDECRGHPLSVIIMAKKMRHRPVRDYLLPRRFLEIADQSTTTPRVSRDLPRLSSDLKQMYEKLVYDHAHRLRPSEKIRNCFTYLSLFPEDHHFCREEVVDLWAAENSISLEEADDYFEAFMREGAFVPFEPPENNHDSSSRRKAYKMRELLPYFAQHVSSKNVHLALSPDSFDLLQLDPKDDPPLCQHLSFVCDPESTGFPIDVLFEGSPWLLRTLLLLGPSSNEECWVRDIAEGNKFRTFKFLRVLHVRGISVGNLLHGVEKHSNLVYLNVSQSDIKVLPDSIRHLGSLKILKLSHCRQLRSLPKSIGGLLHLEKLDLEGCLLLARWPLDWVGKLFRLEYLNLSHIDFESLPGSIGNLRNLKALILAYCARIQRLPKSTIKLPSLEKLDVEGCPFLKELPESPDQSTAMMTKLKHLNTLHCNSLTRMPSGMGRLSSLKSLTRYVSSDEHGRSITELEPLDNLEGELWLDKLNRLTDAEVARQVNLEKKEKLGSLTLRWEWPDSDAEADHSADLEMAQKVIEALRPSTGLRSLKLILYAAKQLPSWMTKEPPHLTDLCSIKLFSLESCENLPPLGELPHLKVLEISGMDAVFELDGSFYGRNGTFSSLEKLSLSQMPKLRRWLLPRIHGQKEVRSNMFPRLAHLTCIQCPKLEPPSCSFPSMERLTLWLNNEMLYGSVEGLKSMAPKVKKLSVCFCQDLRATSTSSSCEGFWELTSIEELEISACENLTSLPEGIKQLKYLKSLKVVRCRNMRSLPEWVNDHLTSLRSLSFSACPLLRPMRKGLRRRYDLEISIEGCPFLR